MKLILKEKKKKQFSNEVPADGGMEPSQVCPPRPWGGLGVCFQLHCIPVFKNFCDMLRVCLQAQDERELNSLQITFHPFSYCLLFILL